MTNRFSAKDQTCFDTYKGKDILFVTTEFRYSGYR